MIGLKWGLFRKGGPFTLTQKFYKKDKILKCFPLFFGIFNKLIDFGIATYLKMNFIKGIFKNFVNRF